MRPEMNGSVVRKPGILAGVVASIRRRASALAFTFLICVIAGAGIDLTASHIIPFQESIAGLDRSFYDWLFDHRGSEPSIPEVVIVQIDKNAIGNMMDLPGRFSYPFPRSVQAQVLRNLKAAGARVVGLDIVFNSLRDPRPDGSPGEDDASFAAALKECGNVVLASDFSATSAIQSGSGASVDQSSSAQDFPAPLFRDAALAYAPVDIPEDEDGWSRRFVPTFDHLSATDASGASQRYAQFAVRLAGAYRGIGEADLLRQLGSMSFDGYTIPPSADDWTWYQPGKSVRICFAGPPKQSCQFFEFDQAYSAVPPVRGSDNADSGAFDRLKQVVDGKIALVGTTEESEHDNFYTPLREAQDSKRPGVEIQANIIHTLLSHHYYSTVSESDRKGLLWLLVAFTAFVTFSLRPQRAFLVVLPGMALCAWGAVDLFNHRVFVRPTEILIAVSTAYLAETVYLYVTEEARAKSARLHFGRYVGPKVLAKVLDSKHVDLGGEMRTVTVMFVDIVGFTTLSEMLPPPVVVNVLNMYLARMVDCIFKHEGTLDKILGDGLMAYFGAPAPAENAELDATLCAIEMQQIAHTWQPEIEGYSIPPFRIRVGVHSGEAIVGEVGSANQVGYTLIGDTVNVAARLEAMNKDFHTEVLISESVQERLPVSILVDDKGQVPIRGRKEALRVFSVTVPDSGGEAMKGQDP